MGAGGRGGRGVVVVVGGGVVPGALPRFDSEFTSHPTKFARKMPPRPPYRTGSGPGGRGARARERPWA
eukprot:COSAG04_NODE_340_length_16315_cov_1278.534410_8_plen_68_part_00